MLCMYVCLCLNSHNVSIISMIFSFLLLLSMCCLFVGPFSHGLNLLTRSGSEAENISQEKECPLMFVCKVSMLFSYSRDESIFVYFFLGSFYAYKQGGVRLRIHPRKAMLKLCFFKKLKVGKFIAYQVRQ